FLFLLAPDHGPAFEFGNRTAFLDPNHIPHRISVGFVVGVIFLRPANGLLHRRVRKTAFNAHDHGLILLVAHDNAMERTLRHLEPLIPSISSWRATSASRRPSVLQFWSSSRVPGQHRPSGPVPAFRRAFVPQWSSSARCHGG